MRKYQKLFGYIDYFENLSAAEACRWNGGEKSPDNVITMPYPVYNEQVTSFIAEVYESGLMDYDYMDTLKKYRLEITDNLASNIKGCNLELARALLTFYVRQERFCDGLWISAIEDKVFYSLLIRLSELEYK